MPPVTATRPVRRDRLSAGSPELPMLEMSELLSKLKEQDVSSGPAVFLEKHGLASPEGVRALQACVRQLGGQSPRRALEVAALALLAAEGADEGTRLVAQRARAQALWAGGHYAPAAALHKEIARRHEERGEAAPAASAHMARIESLAYVGQVPQAFEAAARARRLYGEIGDRLGQAKVDANLGIVSHRLDRCREALRLFARARRVFSRNGDAATVALIDQNRALAHSLLGHPQRARELFDRAHDAMERLGLDLHVAIARYNRAYDWFLNGLYDRAYREMEAAHQRFRALGHDYGAALAELDLAEMSAALGTPVVSRRWADAAAEAFESLGVPVDRARAQSLQAAAQARLGDLAGARRSLEQAVATFEREAHPVRAALARLDLASLLLTADAARSRELAGRSRRELERSGFRNAAARGLLVEGLAAGEGDPAAARQLLSRAVRAARRRGVPDLGWRARAALARLELHEGGAEAARRHFSAAVEEIYRLRADVRRSDLQAWILGDRIAVYEEAMRAWLDPGEEVGPRAAREVFALAERARSRALLDAVAAAGAGERNPLREVRSRRAEQVRRRLDAHYSTLVHRRRGVLAEDDVAAAIAADERELEALQGPRDLEASLAVHGLPERHPRSCPLVAYQRLGDELWVLIQEAGRLTARLVTAKAGEVDELGAELEFQLSRMCLGNDYARRHAGRLEALAARVLDRLGEILLRPIASALGEEIVIVPSGGLFHLPFPALKLDGQALVERTATSLAPSATVLALLERRRSGGRRAPLVVGVGAPSIPEAEEEARAVAGILPRARLLVGADASRERVLREAPGRRVIHIATHGLFRPERPTLSSLLLADGWLPTADVYGMGLDAELVALSACQSGRHQVGVGDELLGLLSAFLTAGARSVAATLWSVDDQSARRLMTDFYAAWNGGESKGRSLRAAMLRERQRAPHPFYWAPYVLVGAA